jgi:quinone-modifying oxidoreductase subunit QmoC
VVIEILTHNRFGKCEAAKPRKIGHFLFLWGFIGAFITTGVVVIAMYGFAMPLPVPQNNWMKYLGNASAILLVLGGAMLLMNRLSGGDSSGATKAFDSFFLFIAIMVGVTGAGTELGRLFLHPSAAVWIYISHLSFILCLFATFPYSKFAHMVYRTLAMVHENLTTPARD